MQKDRARTYPLPGLSAIIKTIVIFFLSVYADAIIRIFFMQ
jgi:hypothetical protein